MCVFQYVWYAISMHHLLSIVSVSVLSTRYYCMIYLPSSIHIRFTKKFIVSQIVAVGFFCDCWKSFFKEMFFDKEWVWISKLQYIWTRHIADPLCGLRPTCTCFNFVRTFFVCTINTSSTRRCDLTSASDYHIVLTLWLPTCALWAKLDGKTHARFVIHEVCRMSVYKSVAQSTSWWSQSVHTVNGGTGPTTSVT